jgi:hypothetical protein
MIASTAVSCGRNALTVDGILPAGEARSQYAWRINGRRTACLSAMCVSRRTAKGFLHILES